MHDLIIIAIAGTACVALGYQQYQYIRRVRRIRRRLNEIKRR